MNAETLIRIEDNYKKIMKEDIEPFLKMHMTIGSFHGNDASLIYKHYTCGKSNGKILIVHGFSEFADKYNELIFVLLKNGYSIYIPELRGHGRSQRFVNEPGKVDVSDFDDYIRDLHILFKTVIELQDGQNYILGHSMGGSIAIRYIEKYPNDFGKAILSSPMIRMQTDNVPFGVTMLWAGLKKLLGKGTDYVIGHGDFNPEDNFNHSSCKSRSRYEYIMEMRKSDILYQTWSADYRWLYAACKNSVSISKSRNIDHISIPVLLFAAGEDRLVNVAKIEKFYKKLKCAQYHYFANARHEIFNSTEADRVCFYEQLLKFII